MICNGMNTEAERQACNIRLRAERKVGQMLKETQRNQGANNQYASVQGELKHSEYQQAKEQAGKRTDKATSQHDEGRLSEYQQVKRQIGDENGRIA